METKTCERCKKTIYRVTEKRTIPMVRWVDRRFCGRACAATGNQARRIAAGPRGRDMIEDVKWIIHHDHPDSVARRVGYKDASTLRRRLAALGEVELAAELRRKAAIIKAGYTSDPEEVTK